MLNTKKFTIFLLLIYSTLLVGYMLGEDSLGGAFDDYSGHAYIAEKFNNEFIDTLFTYDSLGHRHSPIFYIFKSFLINFGEEFQRLFFLHLFLLIPIFFYKSLKIIYPLEKKNSLKFFALILLLFPTFRAYSIWPDPHLLGTLFFLIAIYFFLKFQKSEKYTKIKFAYFNVFFVSLAGYASPNYSVFAIYFFINYFLVFKINKYLIYIIFLNILLSIPFFYYVFFLDINFIFSNNGWNIGSNFYSISNISSKIILILSIIIFYLFPFLLSKSIKVDFKFYKENLNLIFLFSLIFIIFCFFFEFEHIYNLTNSGGGFVYNLSKLLFNNNFLLFAISYASLLILLKFFKENYINFILFLCLIFSNPQTTLWQANFSPIVFIFILLLFNFNIDRNKLENKQILINYVFISCYYLISLFRENILAII